MPADNERYFAELLNQSEKVELLDLSRDKNSRPIVLSDKQRLRDVAKKVVFGSVEVIDKEEVVTTVNFVRCSIHLEHDDPVVFTLVGGRDVYYTFNGITYRGELKTSEFVRWCYDIIKTDGTH